MRLIRGLHNFSYIAQNWSGCVATIGNFDGFHRGHRQLIARLQTVKQQHQLPSVVIVFEPQPREYFAMSQAPIRLMRLSDKIIALQDQGIDFILCLYFDRELAMLSANDFIQQILVNKLRIQHLVVGDDFQFGSGREGNLALLKHMGGILGFCVDEVSTVLVENRRVSSSWLRDVLRLGDLTLFSRLADRPFRLIGRVMHGAKRGQRIGFPTANISLRSINPPLRGVYVVTVDGVYSRSIRGVANLGCRPTVDGASVWLEVHLFDFNEVIYGRKLQVNFHQKLRDEKKFDSLDHLKTQIALDVDRAKTYFSMTKE